MNSLAWRKIPLQPEERIGIAVKLQIRNHDAPLVLHASEIEQRHPLKVDAISRLEQLKDTKQVLFFRLVMAAGVVDLLQLTQLDTDGPGTEQRRTAEGIEEW